MKKMLMVFLAILLLAVGLSFLLHKPTASIATPCHAVDTSDIIIRMNKERSKVGLPALQESSLLDHAANMKAHDMVTVHYWAHDSPSGTTPWYWMEKVDYPYGYAGENLEENTEAGDVVAEWMSSPGHKANILNPYYKEVGVATTCGYTDREVTLVVSEYGTKK